MLAREKEKKKEKKMGTKYECLIVRYGGELFPVILPVPNCPDPCPVRSGQKNGHCPYWCRVGGPDWDKEKETERQVREHLLREAGEKDYAATCRRLAGLPYVD